MAERPTALHAAAAPVPLVVGVTSHRNLAVDEIEPIRLQIAALFARLKAEFPELPLVLLSALAEGGDQLAASEALAAGAGLIAPLPLPSAMYAEDFSDQARARFDELCARADVVSLPLLPGHSIDDIATHGAARDRQYAQAGVYVASHCHLLLTLWDGRESELLGGTAQVVRYALDGVMPGLVERRRGAVTPMDRVDESVVYHIACSRSDANAGVQGPEPPLRPLQARWVSQKSARSAEAGMPAEFQCLFERMAEFNRDQRRYGQEIRQSAAATDTDAPADLLDQWFNAADVLAMHFQRRVLLTLRGIHVLAALTGIAFILYSDLPSALPYQFYAIYVFVLLFAVGGLLAWLARRREWHRKYVDYRALAEGLRVQRWWRRAGVTPTSSSAFAHDNFMQTQDIQLGWIRNVMRSASMDRLVDPSVPEAQLAGVIVDWVGEPGSGGQLDYYTRKTAQRLSTHRTTVGLGRACLWAGIAIAILLALFQRQLGSGNTNLLVAVMGVLAILAAARESYAFRKGDRELIEQYRYMFGIFAGARKQLDAARDADHRREILRALGEAAMAEHAKWALLHRERPLENTRF